MPVQPRSGEENRRQLEDILVVLKLNIDAFKAGKTQTWMVLSAYLHQLLTDQSRGDPLVKRIFTSVAFHPLRKDLANAQVNFLLAAPGMSYDEKGVQVHLFDLNRPRIPLDDWLLQVPLINEGQPIQIKSILRVPRNEGGGAHFDPHTTDDMRIIDRMLTVFDRGQEASYFKYVIASIAEYVYFELLGKMYSAFASSNLKQKQFGEAKKYIELALNINRQSGDLEGQCLQLTNLGLVHLETKNDQEARICLSEALSIGKQVGDTEIIQTASAALQILDAR